MLFIALAIFGVFALYQDRAQRTRTSPFPIVVVSATYPGASPQEMERLVVKPIEDQIDGIDNLDQMSATAEEGSRCGRRPVQARHQSRLWRRSTCKARVDTARVYMPADLDPPFVDKNGASRAAARPRAQFEHARADRARRPRRTIASSRSSRHSERPERRRLRATRTRVSRVARPARLLGTGATLPTSSTPSRRITRPCPAACASRTRETTSRCTPTSTARTTCSASRCTVPGQRRSSEHARRRRRDRRRRARRAASSRITTARRVSTSSSAATSPPTRSSRPQIVRDQLKTIERAVSEADLRRNRRARRLHAEVAQRRLAVADRGRRADDDRDDALPARLAQRARRHDRDPELDPLDVHRDEACSASISIRCR